MLRAARAGARALGQSSQLVRQFLLSQQMESGGFKDRLGKSDLYYTVFGFEGLLAVSPTVSFDVFERLQNYLSGFKDGEGLDFVHLCCLARCWAVLIEAQQVANPSPGQMGMQERTSWQQRLAAGIPNAWRALWQRRPASSIPNSWQIGMQERLAKYRAPDGGFNMAPGSSVSTVYSAFLGLGACQDLGVELPDKMQLAKTILGLQLQDGSWSNAPPGVPQTGSTNATAAVVSALASYGGSVPRNAGQWLLARAHSSGGFTAGPGVPMPDLLSTATSLHALAAMGAPLEPIREPCLDFIDSLWTNQGGFHGHWLDDALDCEYTFYGLLAIGHLSR